MKTPRQKTVIYRLGIGFAGLILTASILYSLFIHSGTFAQGQQNETSMTTGTLDIRVTTSADDVEERLADGAMYLDSSDLELGNDPAYLGDQTVGVRFTDVNIPQGATITQAYIEFETDAISQADTSLTFFAHADDNAPPFTTVAHNLTSRTKSAANVTWNNIPTWATVNETHQSPDLSTLVQEIVNRSGWAAGNSLAFIIAGTGTREAESYDGEPAAAPLLHIAYQTGPVPPTATPTNAVATSTATTTPPSQAIRFGMIGDFGNDSTAEGDVATLLAGQNVELIVTAGDNRYGSLSFDRAVGRYYCNYLAEVTSGSYCAGGNRAVNAFFPSPGNHDYDDGGGISEYLNYFTLPGSGVATSGTSGNERYYDVIKYPVHFFLIDSDAAIGSSAERAAQQAWLQSQLAASTTPWQLVILHHAPYSSARHGSNSIMQWPYAAWGADAVLAGHDHTYERILQDGIVYFVNGLGGRSPYSFNTPITGSEVRYNSDHGAMIIDANTTAMNFRFLNRANVEIDTYTIGVSTPTPTATPVPTVTPIGTPGVVQTIEVRIAQGDDDVEESVTNGTVNLTSSDLELVDDSGNGIGDQRIGLRFTNVPIPQGAYISAAYLEFEVDETNSEGTTLTIRAQASDNAPGFSNTAYNVSSRTLTAAAVNWTVPAWDTVNAKHQSPDLATVIQAVTDRTGWSNGNSLVLVISGSGHRTAESHNGEATAAPLLHVEYSTTPIVANDLIAEALEVTQAIQDLDHTVRLVQDKRTYVRFYAHTDQGSVQVPAQLEVQRGSQSTILAPVNGDAANTVNLGTASSRATLNGSYLFELPAGFKEGTVTLIGRLNSQGSVSEDNSSNNSASRTVTFEPVPPMHLVLYNVGYGSNYYASEFDLSMLESWLRRAYPISNLQVTRRTVYYGGNIPSCEQVRNLMASDRTADLAAGTIPTAARYYGMVTDQGSFMRGCGWGHTSTGPTGSDDRGWDYDGTYGDWYGGHELGHGYYRHHANFCGATDGDPYPHPNGQISPVLTGNRAIYGFDVETQAIYGPDWTDVMTYCKREWISDFTYEGLMDTIQSLPVTAAKRSQARFRNQTERLLIAGTINPTTGETLLDPIFMLPNAGEVEERITGAYTIVLRNDTGGEVARYPFTPQPYHYGAPAPASDVGNTAGKETDPLLGIHEFVPYLPDVTTVDILGQTGELLNRVVAQTGKPIVAITAPPQGEIITSDAIAIAWTATEPDGEALVYHLQYSVDKGATWETITRNLTKQQFTVERRHLRQSQDLRFRVWASDGIHTSSTEMAMGIALPVQPLTAKIGAPLSSGTVIRGDSVLFQGRAYDIDHGVLSGTALRWFSDRDGPLGSGQLLTTASLSVGNHIITLEAQGPQGNVTTDTIQIQVQEAVEQPNSIFLPFVSNQ